MVIRRSNPRRSIMATLSGQKAVAAAGTAEQLNTSQIVTAWSRSKPCLAIPTWSISATSRATSTPPTATPWPPAIRSPSTTSATWPISGSIPPSMAKASPGSRSASTGGQPWTQKPSLWQPSPQRRAAPRVIYNPYANAGAGFSSSSTCTQMPPAMMAAFPLPMSSPPTPALPSPRWH